MPAPDAVPVRRLQRVPSASRRRLALERLAELAPRRVKLVRQVANAEKSRAGRHDPTLFERLLRAHEQQKARLAEQEAELGNTERKVFTRQLIEVCCLVDKAGLLGLSPNALYGALLAQRDGASDANQVSK